MGPEELAKLKHELVYGKAVTDLVLNGGANLPPDHKWTVGRNGQKKEISEAEVIAKYLERKAENGEFIETMKVTTLARPDPALSSQELARRLRGPRSDHSRLGGRVGGAPAGRQEARPPPKAAPGGGAGGALREAPPRVPKGERSLRGWPDRGRSAY